MTLKYQNCIKFKKAEAFCFIFEKYCYEYFSFLEDSGIAIWKNSML